MCQWLLLKVWLFWGSILKAHAVTQNTMLEERSHIRPLAPVPVRSYVFKDFSIFYVFYKYISLQISKIIMNAFGNLSVMISPI